MTKIKIAFRQIIDSNSTSEFEKQVFSESFREFCLQAQAYNAGGKLKTFESLVNQNPKANSLHYKVGFSVGLYIAALKNIIPGLTDSIGKPVGFESHEFIILSSDISNKASHKVAIIFVSDWLDLLALTGSLLVVGKPSDDSGNTLSALTISLRENLSIVEWDGEVNSKITNGKYDDQAQLA